MAQGRQFIAAKRSSRAVVTADRIETHAMGGPADSGQHLPLICPGGALGLWGGTLISGLGSNLWLGSGPVA